MGDPLTNGYAIRGITLGGGIKGGRDSVRAFQREAIKGMLCIDMDCFGYCLTAYLAMTIKRESLLGAERRSNLWRAGKIRNAMHRYGLLRLLPYGLPRNDLRLGSHCEACLQAVAISFGKSIPNSHKIASSDSVLLAMTASGSCIILAAADRKETFEGLFA